MLHDAEIDRLLSDLNALREAARGVHGEHLVVVRLCDAVAEFEDQPTIWDAFEGRNRRQGWELPSDFSALFGAWTAAHRQLAAVRPQDLNGLADAVEAAEAASDALLAELYRCKDQRVGRLMLAFDLFAAGEEIVRQNLRRQHPAADPESIERLVDEWLFRPGAESIDGWGRRTVWPRTAP